MISNNNFDEQQKAGRTYILCGPQGIGKTGCAEQLRTRLGCHDLIESWNGVDPLPPGSLAITNAEYTMPEGGVAFRSGLRPHRADPRPT